MRLKIGVAVVAVLVVGGCKSGELTATTIVPAQTQVDAQVQKLSCTIDATNYPWNPAGQMDVKVDGVSVGAFGFDRRGSSALNFGCTAGIHSFRMEAAGAPINCEGNFTVDATRTDFLPTMNVLKKGQVVCGLSVNGKA